MFLLPSLTSFDGHGFFPGTIPYPNGGPATQAVLEAVSGLFLELSFITAFTRRFYAN